MTLTASILIPAFNRAGALRKTLATIVPLCPEDVTILVVDDCSATPDVRLLVSSYEGRVAYARTPTNIGVIGARNFGYRLTSSDIVFHLDDDSYFVDVEFIPRSLAFFSERPRAGVLAFNIRQEPRGLAWASSLAPFEAFSYPGGGCAWRRLAIEAAQPYYPGFWRQGEETEHTLRVYDSGWEVWAMPNQLVAHDESPINRHPRTHKSLASANYLKRVILRAPLRHLPVAAARWLGFTVVHLRSLSLTMLLRELAHKDRGIAATMRDRVPILPATYRRVDAIRLAQKRIMR